MVKKVINKTNEWNSLTKWVIGLATGLITVILIGFTSYVANGALKAHENSKTIVSNKSVIEQIRKDVSEMKGDIKVLLERTK